MKSLRAFEIVEYIEKHKFCSLAELMEKFHVSQATIHRDVSALVRDGRIRKVHGGVAFLRTGVSGAGQGYHAVPLPGAHEYRHARQRGDRTEGIARDQ